MSAPCNASPATADQAPGSSVADAAAPAAPPCSVGVFRGWGKAKPGRLPAGTYGTIVGEPMTFGPFHKMVVMTGKKRKPTLVEFDKLYITLAIARTVEVPAGEGALPGPPRLRLSIAGAMLYTYLEAVAKKHPGVEFKPTFKDWNRFVHATSGRTLRADACTVYPMDDPRIRAFVKAKFPAFLQKNGKVMHVYGRPQWRMEFNQLAPFLEHVAACVAPDVGKMVAEAVKEVLECAELQAWLKVKGAEVGEEPMMAMKHMLGLSLSGSKYDEASSEDEEEWEEDDEDEDEDEEAQEEEEPKPKRRKRLEEEGKGKASPAMSSSSIVSPLFKTAGRKQAQ